VKERGSMKEVRRISEIMSTSDKAGRFVDMSGDISKSPAVRRIGAGSSMSVEDIVDEIMIRADMRRILSETASKKGEEFLGPKWIVFANEYLAHRLGTGSRDRADIVAGFEKEVLSASGQE
ncbi:MAG: hypothetical protein J6Y18_03150, partial [Candidatus Methanomethylophilaceae archaeon]|nr:hypothetical protein [Candidatus Methanomethylophilaceae archaeon]